MADFQGNVLYLDTMILYAFMRAVEPTAQTLFSRIESGDLVAFTSVLTFDELSYHLLLALIRERHGGSPLERLRQDEAALISELYPALAPQLAALRSYPNLSLVDVVAADLELMDDHMLRYHLRPRDALHLAAMQKCGCFDLLSNDTDFDRVPFVQRYTLTS
ncbi:MAG TPA: type II toxin-antitoxin system VapC family toxin [Ardenticatenaceae bacterium]